MQKELTCIGCPMGCALQVEINEGKVVNVSGNTCKRGEIYAQKECTNPTRILTTTVKVIGGVINCVSVKTKTDIPKTKIAECMEQVKTLSVKAPVRIGDIILKNMGDTAVDLIATKNVDAENK